MVLDQVLLVLINNGPKTQEWGQHQQFVYAQVVRLSFMLGSES